MKPREGFTKGMGVNHAGRTANGLFQDCREEKRAELRPSPFPPGGSWNDCSLAGFDVLISGGCGHSFVLTLEINSGYRHRRH